MMIRGISDGEAGREAFYQNPALGDQKDPSGFGI